MEPTGIQFGQIKISFLFQIFIGIMTANWNPYNRALASGEVVQIHPSSVLFRKKPECVIFNELIQTTNKYVRNLTRVDHLWLTELAPKFYAMQN